jgi:hypothetical protein
VNGDDPVEVMRWHMNRLRGRLFAVVEAVGLPRKQENAIKGLIRTTTYDLQADLEESLKNARHTV